MDGDFVLDLDYVIESIETAEVLSLSFPNFNRSLVIDTRSNSVDGPLVCIEPMVGSPRERMRNIRSMRSGFPRIDSLTVIPWLRYVDSLVTLGVWDRIVKRFADSGQDDAVAACGTVLSELRRLEGEELTAVVLGRNYHTIWPPDKGSP